MKPSVGLLFIMVQFYLLELTATENPDVTKTQETKDPCDSNNHIIIDEPERAVGFDLDPEVKHRQLCDRNLTEGWYHFKLNGVTAIIPTMCLRSGSCGGSVAMRIDMEGQDLPAVDKEIHAWTCGSFEILGHWDCCVLRQTTRIRNCGKYLLYYLYPVDRCPVSYCVHDPQDDIPEKLAVKQGEAVDDESVQTTTATLTLFSRCPEGQFKCTVNNTMTCIQKCNGVVDCDDGADETDCYGRTTMIDEIFPAPPPTAEEEYDSLISDSSGTGENDITNSTDDVIATRSLYSVSTTPLDSLQDGDSTTPSQTNDNTDENVTPNIKDDISGKNVTLVGGNEAELTTASSTLLNDVLSTDDGVTNAHKKSLPGESSSSSSFSSNKNTKLTTEYHVSESDNTTDVSGVTRPLKPDQGKYITSTTTTYISSSVSVRDNSTGFSATHTETTNSTSHRDKTSDEATVVQSISTTSTTPATQETMTKETTSSTTEIVMSSITIAEAPTQSEDGRVVLVFRPLNGQIEDKPNSTAMMKLALSNVLRLMVSDTEPEYVSNQSIVLTDGPTHHHGSLYLTFRLERDNGIVPADRLIQFFRVLQHSQQDQLPWHVMNLKLDEFYKPGDRPETHHTERDTSLFKDNLILFIAIIAIGSVCIIVIIFGLLYIRCRNRRRSWDRNSDMKSTLSDAHHVHTVENPATDAEIMKDEINPLKETSLSTQDPRQASQLPPGAPPEDENGWIVPLDQAEPVAVKTEDTRF